MEPTKPLHERAQLVSALDSMGVTEELLVGAARHGYQEAGSTTNNDVRSMAGFLAWAKPLRFLREQLAPKGWKSSRLPNLETVVHPEWRFQIACAAGNSATGDPRRMPRTRLDKGPLTGLAVAKNAQLSLLPAGHAEFRPNPRTIPTWVLLYFVSEKEEEVEIRAELSLPTHFSGSQPAKQPRRGYIDEFKPRLIPESIVLNDVRTEGKFEQEEIDVPVHRRRSG